MVVVLVSPPSGDVPFRLGAHSNGLVLRVSMWITKRPHGQRTGQIYLGSVRALDFEDGRSPIFIVSVKNDGALSADGVKVNIVVDDNGRHVTSFSSGPKVRTIPAHESCDVRTKGTFIVTSEMIQGLKDGNRTLNVFGTIEQGGMTVRYCMKYSRFSGSEAEFVPCGEDERRDTTVSIGAVAQARPTIGVRKIEG